MSVDQIKDLLGIYHVGDKLYWIDPKVIDTATQRGVGADNLANGATYAGQVFFNPAAGDVGNLPINSFDGPSQFSINLALSKRFRFLSRYSIEFKGEAFNLTNTPSFFVGDMNINSDTFGRITEREHRLARDSAVGALRLLVNSPADEQGPPLWRPLFVLVDTDRGFRDASLRLRARSSSPCSLPAYRWRRCRTLTRRSSSRSSTPTANPIEGLKPRALRRP